MSCPCDFCAGKRSTPTGDHWQPPTISMAHDCHGFGCSCNRPIGRDCLPPSNGRSKILEQLQQQIFDPDKWTPAEPEQVFQELSAMLRGPIMDGARKRQAGEKPNWKVDPSHKGKIFSHLGKYVDGELVDKDSGEHPLVHVAVRALMQAYQETHG